MSMPVRETTGEQGWVLEMPGKLKRWKTVKKKIKLRNSGYRVWDLAMQP